MRIAFVLHDYNRVFGHSRYVAELADRFAPHHQVHIFSNTVADAPPGAVTHHVPAVRATALTTILSFYAAASVRVSRGFDIVHAQGVSAPGANVVTSHISNLRWLEGRRHIEGGHLSWKERLFGATVVPLERRLLRSSDVAVIAVSSAMAADIQRDYGRRVAPIVIPHGVDSTQFNPGVRGRYREAVRQRLHVADDELLHLFVGDLRKGFSQAVAALASAPGRLFGVSRGNPEEALALAARLGLSARVTVMPPTDRIEEYYGAADTFVLPTPYDAFGMVITEAMACGLPVITTTAAGASELVEDGRTGLLLADPADAGALSAAMQRLAGNPAERRQMGDAAAAAMRTLTWTSVADRTMALYERVVSARRVAPPSPSS